MKISELTKEQLIAHIELTDKAFHRLLEDLIWLHMTWEKDPYVDDLVRFHIKYGKKGILGCKGTVGNIKNQKDILYSLSKGLIEEYIRKCENVNEDICGRDTP